MPMCNAHIPKGALPPTAERELLSKVTDLLLQHEGADPSNQAARALAWVFVHRHDMHVAGPPAQAPHHRFICRVPEGQHDDGRRAAVTRAMTESLVEAPLPVCSPGDRFAAETAQPNDPRIHAQPYGLRSTNEAPEHRAHVPALADPPAHR